MTHFYNVFEFPPKSVLLHFGTSRARLEKCMIHYAQFLLGAFLYMFQNLQKVESDFHIFRFQNQENRFSGLGTFLHVFQVQYFTALFTILTIFYKFSPMLHKSFSYEPYRQYGICHFPKTIIKNRNICKMCIGEIRFFLIELPIELPIDSPWNH